jgi:hypothetical protein
LKKENKEIKKDFKKLLKKLEKEEEKAKSVNVGKSEHCLMRVEKFTGCCKYFLMR